MNALREATFNKAEGNRYFACDRLRNGQSVLLRPLGPDDKPILEEEMHHLSEESIYFRFLTPKKELSKADLAYFTEIDMINHVALLASVVEDGAIVPAGVGRYIVDKIRKNSAEVAFEVKEEYQGLGIASILLRNLTSIARRSGLIEFTAYMLAENHKMLDVFSHSGLPMTQVYRPSGITEISLSLLQDQF